MGNEASKKSAVEAKDAQVSLKDMEKRSISALMTAFGTFEGGSKSSFNDSVKMLPARRVIYVGKGSWNKNKSLSKTAKSQRWGISANEDKYVRIVSCHAGKWTNEEDTNEDRKIFWTHIAIFDNTTVEESKRMTEKGVFDHCNEKIQDISSKSYYVANDTGTQDTPDDYIYIRIGIIKNKEDTSDSCVVA